MEMSKVIEIINNKIEEITNMQKNSENDLKKSIKANSYMYAIEEARDSYFYEGQIQILEELKDTIENPE